MEAADDTVLVIGESLVDIVSNATGVTEHPGGSPMNVAIGTSRLGVPTLLLTRIGNDRHGDLIREHLKRSSVQIHPDSGTAEKTSTALAHIQPDGSAVYEFNVVWDLAAVPSPDHLAIVHTGSLATFVSPGSAGVLSGLQAAHDAGTIVTFDPNIRPALLPGRAATLTRFELIARLAHLVKLSDEDAAWLYPGRPLPEVARHISSLGTHAVLITRGADGVLTQIGHRVKEIPAKQVTVVDTIGAGDSFMASLIASLAEAAAPFETLTTEQWHLLCERAVNASGITVSRAGANPPTRSELNTPA